ncbi:MAG: alpha/beta hydrolase family protein [Acidobacteriota bacterium]
MSRRVACVLNSSLISRKIPYRVLLPDAYDSSTRTFPVLYLLHGLFGSFENWTDLTGLDGYVDDFPMIVVMPDAGDSWYTDRVEGEAYESYLVGELIPEIEAGFRASGERSQRLIAGNSMGGYGAFKLALKHRDLFALAGSFSGAFHAPKLNGTEDNTNWDELGPSITNVFGDMDETVRWANYLDSILEQYPKTKVPDLPYLYLDCGKQDGFIFANREMDLIFGNAGIRHEFHELEGGHDWRYWDDRIRHFLEFAAFKFELMSPE